MNSHNNTAPLTGNAAEKHQITEYGSSEAPPIILGHGYGTEQGMWRFVAPILAEKYHVISYDLVGSGKTKISDYDRGRYDSLHGYADDLISLLRELNLGPVHYVGHSVSGMIGALAAIEAPELFSSLVMLGPSPRYMNDGDYVGGFEPADITALLDTIDVNYLGWAEQMAPHLMGNPERPELAGELRESFAALDNGVARHFARVVYLSDHREDLPHVRVPSVILMATEDLVVPPEVGNYLAAHLPDARLVQLSATGHFPHLSAPNEVASKILESAS